MATYQCQSDQIRLRYQSPDGAERGKLRLVRRTVCSGGISAVLEEATAEVRSALALDERDAWAHMTQGQVTLRMRRHGEAERALRRALELNPNFALAHAFLGLPLAHQGRTAKPLRALSTRCD